MGTITDNGWIQVTFDGTCNSSLFHVINPILLLVPARLLSTYTYASTLSL
jgi:hypothetical protein